MSNGDSLAIFAPIADTFEFGATFGYQQDQTGAVRYWDGQDIWLPPGSSDVRALGKGLVKFYRSGAMIPSIDEEEGAESGSIAIGDTLVLQIWPQLVSRLSALLPQGTPIPARVLYQNVDYAGAVSRAKEVIRDPRYVERYRRLFTTDEDPDTIGLSELYRRMDSWIDSDWANGRGIGIFLNPPTQGSSILGYASSPLTVGEIPESVPGYMAQPIRPDAAANDWKVVTLKMQTGAGEPFNPALFLHRLGQDGLPDSLIRPDVTSRFMIRCREESQTLPKLRVLSRMSDDPVSGEEMPPALPSAHIDIQIVGANMPRAIPTSLDTSSPDRVWLIHSRLPPGDYQWTQTISQLYAQRIAEPAEVDFTVEYVVPTVDPVATIRLEVTHWIAFRLPDGRTQRRFVLGVNMETIRRKHDSDLAPNEVLGRPHSYLDSPTTGANRSLLQQDLDNISSLGVSAIRVWVFEGLEGLRFHFTTTSPAGGQSILDDIKQHSDVRTNGVYLTDFSRIERPAAIPVVPPLDSSTLNQWIFASSREEYERSLRPLLMPRDSTAWVSQPDPMLNPTFQALLDNAAFLQEEAGRRGLRVLWTIWVHYGEQPQMYLTTRAGEAGQRVEDHAWERFIRQSSLDATSGRLPVEAWIYRELMVNDQCRRSFIENAVKPFVRRMEQSPGEPLGYEVMNEPEIVWQGMAVWDGNPIQLAGTRLETHWLLSTAEVETFLRECAAGISDTLRSLGKDRPITAGVQGSYRDDQTDAHLSLTMQRGVTVPGLTRYATADGWRLNIRRVMDSPNRLLRNGIASLFTEAGRDREPKEKVARDGLDCGGHSAAVKQILDASLLSGYSGAFLWHYNNPARTSDTYFDSNALTERANSPPEHRPGANATHPAPVPFAGARPACAIVKGWVELIDVAPHVLPQLRRGP